MKAERQLELANKLERIESAALGHLAVMAVGLLPVMFIGPLCMCGESVLAEAAVFACLAYMAGTILLFFTVMILHFAEVWFRDRWWRKTEDPWKVWEYDHYGKVSDD